MAAVVPPAPEHGSGENWTGMLSPSPVEAARLAAQVARDVGSRYEVLGYLGRGAFATVWKAHDRQTSQTLAIKRFDGRRRDGHGFFRELSAQLRLSHPRFVQVINLLEASSGIRYLFLEHCAGGSLRAALSRARAGGTVCAPERAAVLAAQMADGLTEAHRLGLVHRDLKPENVLFCRAAPGWFGGRSPLKLADLGLTCATRRQREPGALHGLSGSPAYMAPEQFEGRFSPASDLYALGVLLYELLHGRLPFEGTPEQVALHHMRSGPVIDPALPAPWPALLRDLLDKEPTRRPAARAVCKLLGGE